MDSMWYEVGIAVVLVAAAIALVKWYLGYKDSRSESRMLNMLRMVGVDPEIIEDGDHDAIINAVRKRCRKCSTEDVCERWLAGQFKGDNAFCPNAHIFDVLAEEHQPPVLMGG